MAKFTLSTQLIKPNYLVILPPTQHHSFFRNLLPLTSKTWAVLFIHSMNRREFLSCMKFQAFTLLKMNLKLLYVWALKGSGTFEKQAPGPVLSFLGLRSEVWVFRVWVFVTPRSQGPSRKTTKWHKPQSRWAGYLNDLLWDQVKENWLDIVTRADGSCNATTRLEDGLTYAIAQDEFGHIIGLNTGFMHTLIRLQTG